MRLHIMYVYIYIHIGITIYHTKRAYVDPETAAASRASAAARAAAAMGSSMFSEECTSGWPKPNTWPVSCAIAACFISTKEKIRARIGVRGVV